MNIDRPTYTCSWCGKPVYEGRANYSKRVYGVVLCGSQENPSYCVGFQVETLRNKDQAVTIM